MTYIHYQNAKHRLQEVREQAYYDYLACKFQPSFRQHLARVFSTLATWLEPRTQAQTTHALPFKG